ncbi:MAG: sulfatase-like hydrolase/transferase [Actinobacteria bacterium]|nr:sulfatase-like hydrolase/transferase [Actinomycetota bacterium]
MRTDGTLRSFVRTALRRRGLYTSLALLALVGPLVPGAQSYKPIEKRDGSTPPNILIVMTDDQRGKGTMQALPRTKRWLETEGVEFTEAYATTPLCCPSRASIFSGRYVHNHGVKTNFDPSPLDQSTTIQALLKGRGYQTAIVGKYFNLWDPEDDPPFFDRWSISRYGYYDAEFNIDGHVRRVSQYATSFIGDKSLEYLEDFERDDAAPWLMFVHPTAPHAPYSPPPSGAFTPSRHWRPNPAILEADTSDKPDFITRLHASEKRAKKLRDEQLVALAPVDVLVSDLRERLEALDETRETLVIFTSDQGDIWGEHGRQGKRVPYLQATHVPLLMSWPGRLEGGVSDDRLVANIDFAPTIAEAAGLEIDDDRWDGLSMLGDEERETLLLEYYKDPRRGVLPAWKSLLTDRYQYIEYYDETGLRIAREYYDLERDPWQLTNLLGRQAGLGALSRELRDFAICAGRNCLR